MLPLPRLIGRLSHAKRAASSRTLHRTSTIRRIASTSRTTERGSTVHRSPISLPAHHMERTHGGRVQSEVIMTRKAFGSTANDLRPSPPSVPSPLSPSSPLRLDLVPTQSRKTEEPRRYTILDVGHDTSPYRFVLPKDSGKAALLEYSLSQRKQEKGAGTSVGTVSVMDITHTFVPPDLRGQGVAGILATAAFEYAKVL